MDKDDVKQKLNDYATSSAWNKFVDDGGKVEDYNRYAEIKKELEEENKKIERESENK